MRSITATEAARLTGLHVETVRGYLRTKRIRADKVGRIYLIDPVAIAALMTDRPRRGRPRRVG